MVQLVGLDRQDDRDPKEFLARLVLADLAETLEQLVTLDHQDQVEEPVLLAQLVEMEILVPLEIMEEPGRLVQPDLMVELAPLANKELKAELVLQGRSVHSELTAGLDPLGFLVLMDLRVHQETKEEPVPRAQLETLEGRELLEMMAHVDLLEQLAVQDLLVHLVGPVQPESVVPVVLLDPRVYPDHLVAQEPQEPPVPGDLRVPLEAKALKAKEDQMAKLVLLVWQAPMDLLEILEQLEIKEIMDELVLLETPVHLEGLDPLDHRVQADEPVLLAGLDQEETLELPDQSDLLA